MVWLDVVKLIKYIHKQGVNIKCNRDIPFKATAHYVIETNTIEFSPAIPYQRLVYILLHEYGHAVQYKQRRLILNLYWMNRKYRFRCESNAWLKAEHIAKQLGIVLSDEYKKEKEECLKSHRLFKIQLG